MPDYGMVPRALSRLGRQAREIIPMKAEAEERRARIGLTKARTEFEIGEAKEAREHRTRQWKAGEEARGEARKHRALKEPVLRAAGEEARVKMEESGRRRKWLKEPWNPLVMINQLGGNEEEVVRWGSKISDSLRHLGDVRFDPAQKAFMRGEKVITNEDVWQQNSPVLAIVLAELDPLEQAKSRGVSTKASDLIPEYEMKINKLRRIQGGKWVTPESKKWIESKISDAQKTLTRLSKEKLTVAATVPFTYWDAQGKKHTQYISKGQFPGAEREVEKRGGTREKPSKEKKPTATNLNAVLKLIDQFTAKGEREPTSEQAGAINDAAQQFGYQYKHKTGPIRKEDKRWYWFDPDEKAYWTLTPVGKGKEKPKMRGLPKEGPAEPPASMLKEGVLTTFKNGQIWTLKNGVPTFHGEKGGTKHTITR